MNKIAAFTLIVLTMIGDASVVHILSQTTGRVMW